MDGASFRSLGNEVGVTAAAVFNQVVQAMDSLPDNTRLTLDYCNRYSGVLNVDGKYVAVKGYQKKIPFIYAIDFLSHDIPVGILTPSESSEAFLRLFRLLKTVNYPLQVVICDDTAALKPALLHYYPKAKLQLCHTHYLENIRQLLHIRTDKDNQLYQHFFNSLVKHVFRDPQNRQAREVGILYVLERRTGGDQVLQSIIVEIAKHYDTLFAYETIPRCPHTNNIIESFNSHLQGRLKTMKGFQSFHNAERWLNAWMLRRRTKPFTDCEAPFTHLNGKTSLSVTTKKDGPQPPFIS